MALRQAKQLVGKKKYHEALLACRQATERSPDWHDMVDEICMHSAATGNIIGFDGRVLKVQPADPGTAWMGQTGHSSSQPLPAGTYSSIADALEAAADADVIQLLPGTHVVSQVCLAVNKRVLIEGSGSTAEHVVLDHRANHPVFNITRCSILRNFSIDMVGFCEAVSISSCCCIKPILQQLQIACSGDGGLLVGGHAQPLLQGCSIQVRNCGVKQHGNSSSTLWRCNITGGTHGLLLCGTSQAFLEGCTIENCSEDGIVGLQNAGVHLTDSCVKGCKGPAIDMADESYANLKHVEVTECCGGVWLWQSAQCEAVSSYISGGSSYAVLLDAQAYARGSSCTIDGPCHDSSEKPLPGGPHQPSSPSRRHMCSAATRQQTLDVQRQAQMPFRSHLESASNTVQGYRNQLAQPATWWPATGAAAAAAAAVAGAFVSPMATPHGEASPTVSASSNSEASGHDVMVYCSRDASAEEGWKANSAPPLVTEDLLVQDDAKAAALFPAEQGAFAVKQRTF